MAERSKRRTKAGKSPILGAAVLKALLLSHPQTGSDAERELYRGVLRDLSLTDEEVDDYLADHAEEVDDAIRAHGSRTE